MPKSSGTEIWRNTPISDRPKNAEAVKYARPGPYERAMEADVQRYINAGASADMRPLCIGTPNGRPCVRPVKNTKTDYCSKECEDD